MEAAERAEKLRIRSEVLKSARDALSLDAEMDRRTGDEMFVANSYVYLSR